MIAHRRIPLWLKIAYSVFVAVMVPVYYVSWGPRNFLFFCDIAVLVTTVGLWLENALLISIEAVAILLPQTVWSIDLFGRLVGLHLVGLTDYMFDRRYSLSVRGLSLFHGWLPLLLIYLLSKLGYNRRALAVQSAVGVLLLLICWFCFNPPVPGSTNPRQANINCVYGFSDDHAQTRLPPWLWFTIVLGGVPLLMYVPTHFILRRVFPIPSKDRRDRHPADAR